MKNLKIASAFFFAFVISSFFIHHSFAQNPVIRNGGFYLFQEFRFQEFSKINNKLTNYGFNSSSNLAYSLGAGGYGWLGRFKVGGEGYYFVSENEDNNQNTQLQGFGGSFVTAYLINPNSKIHFLPMIGLGGESIHLLANKNFTTTDFTQVLENPQTLHLQTGTYYLKTALQIEYKVQKSVMGLQIGYQYSLNQEWQINENSLSNAPSDRLSNFFLRFTIGME